VEQDGGLDVFDNPVQCVVYTQTLSEYGVDCKRQCSLNVIVQLLHCNRLRH
jgi:hypothetical protein